MIATGSQKADLLQYLGHGHAAGGTAGQGDYAVGAV